MVMQFDPQVCYVWFLNSLKLRDRLIYYQIHTFIIIQDFIVFACQFNLENDIQDLTQNASLIRYIASQASFLLADICYLMYPWSLLEWLDIFMQIQASK